VPTRAGPKLPASKRIASRDSFGATQMKTASLSALFARIDAAEYGLCRRLNRGASYSVPRNVFKVASRLGDGVIWYAMLALLPVLYGREALLPVAVMAITGVAGVLLYKALKHVCVRERPFITHTSISQGMPPLDRYSFPSGHTLHAVSFTWQAVAQFPELGWVLVPLAALIAGSRVVLGLHYPTDVLAGAGIGIALATAGSSFT
jgi:undecaprenyl-diphosphatase